MLPLSLFRVPTMAASLLASLFQGLASFAVLFLVLMYLQGPRGLSPINASLLLVPGYVAGAAVGPLGRPPGRPPGPGAARDRWPGVAGRGPALLRAARR